MTDNFWPIPNTLAPEPVQEPEPPTNPTPDPEDAAIKAVLAEIATTPAPEPAPPKPEPWTAFVCPFISGPVGDGYKIPFLQRCLGPECPFWGRYMVTRVIDRVVQADRYRFRVVQADRYRFRVVQADRYRFRVGCTRGRKEFVLDVTDPKTGETAEVLP